MVAIIGTGTLAQSIAARVPSVLFDRQQCDFLCAINANTVQQLAKHPVIINCTGLFRGTVGDIIEVNYLGPVRLIEQLINIDYQGRIILVGSHGASWTSWPGIDLQRLAYNNSKANLRDFVKGLAHSSITNIKLTIVEPTKFQSKINGFQGPSVNTAADIIVKLIDDDSVLHVEMN